MFVLLLFTDQITKYLVYSHQDSLNPKSIIPNVLELQYVENTGAAWGVFSGAKYFFIIITLIAVVLMGIYYLKTQFTPSNLWIHLSLGLMITGAFGNCMDRVFRGFVVDFIYVSCIHFPVFNVADMCVCVGAGIFVIASFLAMSKETNQGE